MTLDLPEDRRRGVGGKLEAALGLEPVDRLEQADGAHLHEIREGLVAAGEAPGQVLDQRQVHLGELVPHPAVSLAVVG